MIQEPIHSSCLFVHHKGSADLPAPLIMEVLIRIYLTVLLLLLSILWVAGAALCNS